MLTQKEQLFILAMINVHWNSDNFDDGSAIVTNFKKQNDEK